MKNKIRISIWLNMPIFTSWVFSLEHKKKLDEALPDCEISLYNDSKSFKANLETSDIVLVWVFKQEWLKKAPNLKWIATPSAGNDWFSLDLPKEITIIYAGFHGKIIAETILGAMLGFSRGLFFACQNQEKYLWPRKEIEPYCNSLRGSHVAILGFGKIGRWISKLAKPFGVRITGIKNTLIDPPNFFDKEDKVITIEHLDSVLPEINHLVLALPNLESTNNIIDERRLNLLPNNSYIYNVGRGNAIDENALAKALMNGRIKGAYLDVFKKEPLEKNSPLRQCPNIIITPHTSAIAPNFFDYFIEEFISRYNEWSKKKD